MLPTLTAQEMQAIAFYNNRIRSGDTIDNDLWADEFTQYIFYHHPDGPVVDIGCGIGRAVPILDDLGIRSYLGIDPSTASVEFCQNTFPNYEFEVQEVRQLGRLYPQRFGGFILLNVLMHTPKSDLGQILVSIRASLLDGAVGLLNAHKPSMASFVTEGASDLTFSFYEREEIFDALGLAGLEVVSIRDQSDSLMIHVQTK